MRPLHEKILEHSVFQDNWPRRRRWMALALVWMAGNLQYLLVCGTDSALHQQAFLALIGAFMTVLVSYIFGAVWDDHGKRARLFELTRGDA